MPSPRTDATAGLLRRLDVRLVLALSSLALVALLVSGIALSRVLPGYLEEQAASQLRSAAGGVGLLIRLRTEDDPVGLGNREYREKVLLQRTAEDAASVFNVGSVVILNAADRSQAASAGTQFATQLHDQGLSPDPRVAPYELPEDVVIDLSAPEPPLTLPGSNSLRLRVIVSQPYTTVTTTLERLTGTLVIVGVISLALSALLGILVARRLTGPINRLRRVSGRLAQGHLEERVTPSGVVEIDQLGSQFNVMADRVSESLRLLEADRDRLREFVADVSHELRTPIAALRTFTELQREGTIDEPTRQEFLVRSSEQLRRLEWLSTNLLDLSRIEAGIFPLDVREGDLREPIRAVVEAHAEVADERKVTLTSAVPSEPVVLRFDRERVVQLVNNLVGNALKFTGPGGEVAIGVVDAPEGAEITVRDSGPGIPESELPRIFERFYRGTNVGEARASGSGLGLAIARSIVEMHGGDIGVASVLGKGTVFTVTLPRIAAPVPEPEPEPEPPSRRGLHLPRRGPGSEAGADRAT
jgi:signal transduction histidine kinase